MTKVEIQKKLHAMILDIVEEENIPISDDLKLIDDYGLDSMGFLALSVQIQRDFAVTIESAEWKNIETLGELTTVVEQKISATNEK